MAVDLYDGCVLYDFASRELRLVDLDHYRPAPYVLDVDRQLGSSSSMAPEEFQRGATIDERTMVHTLGRLVRAGTDSVKTGPQDLPEVTVAYDRRQSGTVFLDAEKTHGDSATE